MALRRGFRPQATRSKRTTAWGFGPGGEAQTALSGSVIVIMGSGVVLTTNKVTIVRTRGEFVGALTSAVAAQNGFIGAIGVGLVTTAAFSIGITAIPGPIDEAGWDGWLYHRFFSIMAAAPIDGGAAADGDLIHPTTAALRVEVDSKAMRKFDEDMTLMAAAQVVEIGTATAQLSFNSRVLVKLG